MNTCPKCGGKRKLTARLCHLCKGSRKIRHLGFVVSPRRFADNLRRDA